MNPFSRSEGNEFCRSWQEHGFQAGQIEPHLFRADVTPCNLPPTFAIGFVSS